MTDIVPFKRKENIDQCYQHDIPLATLAALATTPYELIPAAGPNTVIRILSISSVYTPGGVAASTGAGKLQVVFGTSTASGVTDLTPATPLHATNIINEWAVTSPALAASAVNKAINLKSEADCVNAGNGSLRIIIRFTVLETT